MRDLTLDHLEVDELWTYVLKKQSPLTMDERAERGDIGDMYIWLALDKRTKLIPTFAIGKRSADMARRFMVDVAGRLVFPKPHDSDAHNFRVEWFRYVTQISTDGFFGYREAVDLAFGQYARHGQIIKDFRNAVMPYVPSELVGTQRQGIRGIDKPMERTICTSHIERCNLTARTFLKRLNRLTICFSKKLDHLAAAVGLFVAHYDYCWRTRYEDHSGQSGRLRPTAAMMAGVADHIWSVAELFETLRRL
jgi:IS1 family transposase